MAPQPCPGPVEPAWWCLDARLDPLSLTLCTHTRREAIENARAVWVQSLAPVLLSLTSPGHHGHDVG